MSLAPGTRIGVYEITAPLGAGGMGEVYRARDSRLNREVAIKVLPDAFTHDPDRLARFTREAHLLAALNHPHIAAIYGNRRQCGYARARTEAAGVEGTAPAIVLMQNWFEELKRLVPID